MTANNWNAVELRDNRYNQIVHMVSAANGAEEFYSTEVSSRIGMPGGFRTRLNILISRIMRAAPRAL